MNCYPVVIPTLCRYEHFKRCVDSLAKCKYANFTELIISIDYPPNTSYVEGYDKIRAYAKTIQGFSKVTILEQQYNLGAYKNSEFLFNYAFMDNDALIYTEDDNEFSPCFLDFMNKALHKFKNDVRVNSICGFKHPKESKGKSIACSPISMAWGFGIWREKSDIPDDIQYYQNIINKPALSTKLFLESPYIWDNLVYMIAQNKSYGDIKRSAYNIVNGLYQVRPSESLVRNWGNDGSGLHCEAIKNDIFSSQKISMSYEYGEINDVDIKKDKLFVFLGLYNGGAILRKLMIALAHFVKKIIIS